MLFMSKKGMVGVLGDGGVLGWSDGAQVVMLTEELAGQRGLAGRSRTCNNREMRS